MSGRNIMDKEFEKWWLKQFVSEFEGVNADHVYNAWNHQQAKIDDYENRIKAIIATQKHLLSTRFNEGLQCGLSESKRAINDVQAAKNLYFEENQKLTNLFLQAEAKIDAQAEYLKALREFANKMYSHYLTMSFGDAKYLLEEDFYRCGLLDMNQDQSMSPTKLLTGEK